MAEIDEKVEALEIAMEAAEEAITTLEDRVSEIALNVSSVNLIPRGLEEETLVDPSPVTVKDADDADISVNFLYLKFRLKDSNGTLVNYTAAEVASDAPLLQSLYDNFPEMFEEDI